MECMRKDWSHHKHQCRRYKALACERDCKAGQSHFFYHTFFFHHLQVRPLDSSSHIRAAYNLIVSMSGSCGLLAPVLPAASVDGQGNAITTLSDMPRLGRDRKHTCGLKSPCQL